MQQDADFITAHFLYMFRASCAHHQERKILTRQPPVQVVMVAGRSSLCHIRDVSFSTLFDDTTLNSRTIWRTNSKYWGEFISCRMWTLFCWESNSRRFERLLFVELSGSSNAGRWVVHCKGGRKLRASGTAMVYSVWWPDCGLEHGYIVVRLPVGARHLSFLRSTQNGFEAHPDSCPTSSGRSC